MHKNYETLLLMFKYFSASRVHTSQLLFSESNLKSLGFQTLFSPRKNKMNNFLPELFLCTESVLMRTEISRDATFGRVILVTGLSPVWFLV